MNKIIVITGGTSGIGLESAKKFAALHHHVVIIGRSTQNLDKAKEIILKETPDAKLDFFNIDLSNIASVKEGAAKIASKFEYIDVLLNNAGGVFSEFELSDIGCEKTITTNHLSHFVLTNKLLPLLQKSVQGRIVNVASDSHFKGKIDFDAMTREKRYFILKAYEQSKLANVLFTYTLADKLKDTAITVNALHPGMVKTDIGNKSEGRLHRFIWDTLAAIFAISVEDGAKTNIFLSLDSSVEKISGKYFDKCKPKTSLKSSYDKELQQKLWDWSEKVTQ